MYYLYHYEWPGIKWAYREERLKKAKGLGYKSILECLVKEYWKENGSGTAANLMGCSRTWTTNVLREHGFPVREKGGVRRILRDLTGERFGRIMVLEATRIEKGVIREYRVRCDCGNEFLHNAYFKRKTNVCSKCNRKTDGTERVKRGNGIKRFKHIM